MIETYTKERFEMTPEAGYLEVSNNEGHCTLYYEAKTFPLSLLLTPSL
jgi:hypothetical protein